jgi:hypothetical protein
VVRSDQPSGPCPPTGTSSEHPNLRLRGSGTRRVYLAAEPSQIGTCELGLLEETVSGRVLEEEREFRIDAQNWKVKHAFDAAFLDWRGFVRMPVTP